MAKLTLSVDDRVVTGAKQYAKLRGVSISEMVEAYLAVVADSHLASAGDSPVLRSVRGILKKAEVEDYHLHLATKYR
jgi:hypothetical protein